MSSKWTSHARLLVIAIMLCAYAGLAVSEGQEKDLLGLDIPYTRIILSNGLTLVVHEDHKAPLVAINVWYHVGSKDEKPGKTGFAHLFEHLMFNGSENYNDDYFRPLEEAGATDMNGTTNVDRTNYFQTVPSTALDLALWMESDRMGHLLGAIDKPRLEEQRSVVKNEKRQGESRPYGKVRQLTAKNTYPAGHPYSWTTIGSMDDIDMASLADVKQWFKDYYGPENATIVIVGDVETRQVIEKVKTYFGDIPARKPIVRPAMNVAKPAYPRRLEMQDRVAEPRLYKIWNIPPWGAREIAELKLAGEILAGNKTSRLYRRLVEKEKLATRIAIYMDERELGSQLHLVINARPDASMAAIEQAVAEEFQKFHAKGPTADEVLRARSIYRVNFLQGAERIGGFGGKSDILARSEVFGASPDAWKTDFKHLMRVPRKQVRETAAYWLDDSALTLIVRPYPKYTHSDGSANRNQLPSVGASPDLDFPALQRTRLDNGLELVLARRPGTPILQFRLLTESGYASDKAQSRGLASIAMAMLAEGTQTRSSQQIAMEAQRLGAHIWAGAGLDIGIVGLSALPDRLAPSMELYADVIRHPAFPETELKRLKYQRLALIEHEQSDPVYAAVRLLPRFIYGEDHAYGQPLTGSGNKKAVAEIDRPQLVGFAQKWLRPDMAKLLVVGDMDLPELRKVAEAAFGDWRAPADPAPGKHIATVAPPSRTRVYLMNRIGDVQTTIVAGKLAPPQDIAEDIRLLAANTLFGGMFTSRLNMNLREEKGWSYGARSRLKDTRGQRLWWMSARVERDQTAPAIREVLAELADMRGSEPVTDMELRKAKNDMTLTLPGRHETSAQLSSSITRMLTYGLPDDYFDNFISTVRALTVEQVEKTASSFFIQKDMLWIIAGDLSIIEKDVRALDLGEVIVIDTQGTTLR